MRTEQHALKTSLAGAVALAVLGTVFGLASGSAAILFDGVFSMIDALMSVVSIAVVNLIARTTTSGVSRRFGRGFWHFEPMVLVANALILVAVMTYALVESVLAVLSGGRDVELGLAIVYAAVVLVLTTTIGLLEHRANKRIGSALVAVDVKGWLMAGGITGALLVAFVVGVLIDGTRFEDAVPYIDPVILIVVAVVLVPVPLATLKKAVAEVALVTPAALLDEAEQLAAEVVEAEGFVSAKVYAAQIGRSRQVEVVFLVRAGEAPRCLEEWDAIRGRVTDALGDGNRNHWITVAFTTRPQLT